MLKALSALPRTVWLIGLISLLNDSASEMIYPLVPLYLASVLMAGPRALGIIEGVAEAAASLLKRFSGVVVDRTRRAQPWVAALLLRFWASPRPARNDLMSSLGSWLSRNTGQAIG